MGEITNKLTIYLCSKDAKAVDDIVEEGAEGIELDGVGHFFSANSNVGIPGWVKNFFGAILGDKFKILSASARGLLIVPLGEGEERRYFAVAFGHGRHFLREGAIDDRFGLKVVLNSVERDSLRSIDKTSLGSLPKQSREQMSAEGEFANFGVDIEQDLVNSVTGRSKLPRLGKIISGKDALSLSTKDDLSTIKDLLPVLLERYQSGDYKSEFDWVDQIKDVRNPKINVKLDTWLLEKLQVGNVDKVWMAPPAVLDWVDVKGFSFSSARKAAVFDDLRLLDFLALYEPGTITLDALRGRRVFVRSAKTDQIFDSWPAYRCLYAEAEIDGATYVLNNSRWYEIATGFAEQVRKEFNEFPESNLALPDYQHASENEYNEALPASLNGSICMDQKLISHGGGRSRIEFCDVQTPEGHLLHVKHYGGSAQLSHLFNQGVVSAELFLQDEDFRQKLNEKLPDGHKLADPKARPNPTEHEVVFGIISQSQKKLEIPFFSKVSLRNARRRLAAYGYKVSIKKIGHAPLPH